MAKKDETKKGSYEARYNELVIEDQEAIVRISSITADRLRNIFGLHFSKTEGGPADPRVPLIIFTETYDAVIEHLVKRRKGTAKMDAKQYDSFQLNFANRFVIGFDNVENDDDEKEGNFMIFIKDIRDGKTVEEPRDPDACPSEKAVEWVNQNITENPEAIKEISLDALDRLAKYGICFYNHELIMPIFCTMYDTMVEYIDMERKELDDYEYEINFAGCFFVSACENADGGSDIIFRPSIDSKTALKDDGSSGSR